VSATSVRLLPVPACDPPYEDPDPRLGVSGPGDVQGTLALAFVLPGDLPAVPEPPARLRLVADDPERRPTPRSDLPDPLPWAARLAQAVVEVLAGDRPCAQLLRWTTESVHAQLKLRAGRAARAGATVRLGSARPGIRSVRLCEPADGIAEVCAVVAHQGRCRALALRLEGADGRWLCTALQVG
jgi:hypothetical protein